LCVPRFFFKIAIKSICLTIEVQRWYPSSTTIFIAGDKTTLDEKDEESYHLTTEEGPPVLEVEHMPSWRRKMPPLGSKIGGLQRTTMVQHVIATDTPRLSQA
jgi:hypothetical protein